MELQLSWCPDVTGEGCRSSVQFSPVTQSCPTLCDPMNYSMPGLPVYYQLLEFTQTHVCWVGDAIQPSHPLSPSPPISNPRLGESEYISLLWWRLDLGRDGHEPKALSDWLELRGIRKHGLLTELFLPPVKPTWGWSSAVWNEVESQDVWVLVIVSYLGCGHAKSQIHPWMF